MTHLQVPYQRSYRSRFNNLKRIDNGVTFRQYLSDPASLASMESVTHLPDAFEIPTPYVDGLGISDSDLLKVTKTNPVTLLEVLSPPSLTIRMSLKMRCLISSIDSSKLESPICPLFWLKSFSATNTDTSTPGRIDEPSVLQALKSSGESYDRTLE